MSFKNATVDLFVSAFRDRTNYKILSQPRLLILDGQTGKLNVGSEVPTRSAAVQTESGDYVQSVEYRSSGVMFSATHRIYRDRVLLKISQQLSSFALTNTSGIDSPTLVKRELDTAVEMNDGEVIILAGLDEVKDSGARSTLPVLGWEFGHSDSRSKSHIFLMLELERVKTDI
ncbi:MAG: hypothetical protein LBI87_08435 [Candidatus Accumulibacter sp.]|nr:hypothetical protein [Accumulibacter sp.]